MDGRLIYAIVVLAVLLIGCFIHWKAADCTDFEEFFVDAYGWITIVAIFLAGGVGFGIIFWGWNWKIILMVAVPVAVLLIACAIHWNAADCIDFEDFFISEKGWVTILAVCGATGIVYGFIFWIWWAMLIITVGVILLTVIGFVIYRKKYSAYAESIEYDESATQKTNHRCPNCGANLMEIQNGYGFTGNKKKYYCDYCGTYFTKKEVLLQGAKEASETEPCGVELSDFEEEYFDACYRFHFRPYNAHTERQIERRYESVQQQIWDNEELYEDTDDPEEALDGAHEFFRAEAEEILNYLNGREESEIRTRYEFYLENYISGADDED